ncbi:hypothetical protein [Actinoplanes sp. NPDC051851]|uniref:hypothetical protein n=1 Tax=Actinoplanes sp. NPDC051851 TaxID=3154753 RepID=UPI0034209526
MTSPPQPTPAEGKPIGQYLAPLRDLAVYVLAGAPAVFLFVSIVDLFGEGFADRTRYSFGGFVNLENIAFPFAAVLLAHLLRPAHPKARLITLVALVEYGVMAFFGVVFGVLFGVSNMASIDAAAAFTALLARAAWLGVFGVAAYALTQIWRGLYFVPKPKPQPGMYGQQPYGAPYGAPYGQPQYGPPGTYGQPQPQPGVYGQPPFTPPPPQPGVYGQPQPPAQPAWNQAPVAAPPFTPPSPAAPVTPVAPASAPPAPPAEATQVVPERAAPSADSTTVLPDDRPGFGPAEQDPPRQ